MFTDEEYIAAANRYKDMIFRIAYSWLKNPDDADDIVQDVLIKLYKVDKEFESDSHLKNWLIRVTVNECKMIFRKPWRKNENIEDYADKLYFESRDYRYLFEAVMKLDRKYRVPLLLFYYEGYSTKEVASILNISVNTVSTRLMRAKAKLKGYLEED